MSRETLVWRFRGRSVALGGRTLIMGILNVTPDSFRDGGRFLDGDAALRRGVEMVAEGADMLDVGGESTRPGATPVSGREEADRVVPVLDRLVREVDVPISVDTRKREVALAALSAGASIINDVTAGADAGMFDAVREAGAGMVLMHMRGTPSTMTDLTRYRDLVGEVKGHLRDRLEAAEQAGIERFSLVIDPGIGFAKTGEQSLLLLSRISDLFDLGRPVLVGPSEKSFIGRVLGGAADGRGDGTAGAVAWLAARGAHVVRVHDVKAMVRVVKVVDAIRSAGRELA